MIKSEVRRILDIVADLSQNDVKKMSLRLR